MRYEITCVTFKAVIIAKGLTKFCVVIIIYTCKLTIVNMTPSEQG